MLRRVLLRLVLALALSLLVIGIYSGVTEDATNRLYNTAQAMAAKAKASVGHGSDDYDGNWDELVDFKPLVASIEAGNTQFDWSDWLDLDKTKMFDNRDLDKKLYPYLLSLNLNEEPMMPYEKKTSPQEQSMIAALYCRSHLSSPFRVVPLKVTNDNKHDDLNVLKSLNGLRLSPMTQYEVQHPNAKLRHRQYGHDEPTPYYNGSDPLISDLKTPVEEIGMENLLFPRVDPSNFNWVEEEVLEDTDDLYPEHSVTLRKGFQDALNSEKHFHEVWIRDDPAGYGLHYDWRFFRTIYPHEEHVAAMHVLARTWQQFAEKMGIIYWYAHGSLLGQVWNGMTMPWDSDHDIQMPIKELDRLARDFNRTLVLQDPVEGYRKFLIDVNPFYPQRTRGNGKNVIDARFIDVDTGMYIDITGLARTNSGRYMVSCKNRHSYLANDFERVVRAHFEGYPAIIPLDANKSLSKEYRTYKNTQFGKWRFNEKLKLWEFTQSCRNYLATFKNSAHVYCFPTDVKKNDGCMDEYKTCDRVVIKEYDVTKDITSCHTLEAEAFLNILPIKGDSRWNELEDDVRSAIDLVGKYYPPFHNSSLLQISS